MSTPYKGNLLLIFYKFKKETVNRMCSRLLDFFFRPTLKIPKSIGTLNRIPQYQIELFYLTSFYEQSVYKMFSILVYGKQLFFIETIVNSIVTED